MIRCGCALLEVTAPVGVSGREGPSELVAESQSDCEQEERLTCGVRLVADPISTAVDDGASGLIGEVSGISAVSISLRVITSLSS